MLEVLCTSDSGDRAESTAGDSDSVAAAAKPASTSRLGRFFGEKGRRRLQQQAEPVPVDARMAHQVRILFLVRSSCTSERKLLPHRSGGSVDHIDI